MKASRSEHSFGSRLAVAASAAALRPLPQSPFGAELTASGSLSAERQEHLRTARRTVQQPSDSRQVCSGQRTDLRVNIGRLWEQIHCRLRWR